MLTKQEMNQKLESIICANIKSNLLLKNVTLQHNKFLKSTTRYFKHAKLKWDLSILNNASKFLFKTAIWEQWKQSSFGSNSLNTQYITYIALFSSVIL